MFAGVLDRLFPRWRRSAAPLELRLYTRADCPLCDTMKAELTRARVRVPFSLVEIDIEGDPELGERFGRSIPVLEIAGRAAFKGRLTVPELERKLARAAQRATRPGGAERARMRPRGGSSRG